MSADNITGKTYFLRGKPVRVLIQWSRERAAPWCGIPLVVFPACGRQASCEARPAQCTDRARGRLARRQVVSRTAEGSDI